MVKGAWVTLATNDSYSLGALVLAHSLKQVGTQKELAVLVTPGVTNSMRARLSEVFNSVKEVNILDSRDKANLKLLQRPELGITFTKLHCWQLTEYEKCVFLDADTLVLQNCDELFEREELSAAPDVGWPDCFNSGVFVYRPSEATYNSLIQFALDKGSFDGGDQGLLNLYFSDWAHKDISKHLPFIYNVCSTAFYSYLPAFKQFGKDVKIIHFIGNAKPWLQYFDTETKKVRPSRDLGHLEPILQTWWNIFCSMIHPNLTPDMISSYPSDPVSARSPDHSSQQSHIEYPVPFDCTNAIPNVWDPWEDYDRHQLNVTLHSSEPLESHNTIALSPVASDHSCIDCSNPISDESFVGRNDQPHTDDNPTNLEYFHDDQSCIQPFSGSSLKDENSVENSFSSSNDTHKDIPQVNSEIVQESFASIPVPINPQENIVSAIPAICEVPILESNPSHLTISLPQVTSHEITETSPKEILPSVSHIPSKYETEEDSDNVPCGVENDVHESGLAGAFAKLTLGQQRTPEQEALENSLRRQNWEQGNIDYLGRDSFDNIWSKICETLAQGPQENEGENSTQMKTDDLVLASPQQETCSHVKDVVSAPQETLPQSAETHRPVETLEKAPAAPIPLPSSAEKSPEIVSVAEIQVSSIPEKISTPEIVTAATKPNLPEILPIPTEDTLTEKTSSATETPESKIVEQIPSGGVSSVEETVSKTVEQIPSGNLFSPGETPKTESTEDEKSKALEQTTSENKSLEGISVPKPVPDQQTPPTEESSKPENIPVPTEPVLSEVIPSSEKELSQLSQHIPSVEKVPSSPIVPSPIPLKPEDSKQVISLEKILSASQNIPPATQAPSLTQQVASIPEQISPEVAVCPCKGPSPPKETSTLKETPASQVPISEQSLKKDTPTSQNLPSTERSSISEETSCTLVKASSPTEISKPEQIPPEKKLPSPEVTPSSIEKACSLEKAPTATQAPPQPAVTSAPIVAQQKTSAPAPADPISLPPSNVAATSTLASSEPPPPITAPPRKNGGNKKQSKSKK